METVESSREIGFNRQEEIRRLFLADQYEKVVALLTRTGKEFDHRLVRKICLKKLIQLPPPPPRGTCPYPFCDAKSVKGDIMLCAAHRKQVQRGGGLEGLKPKRPERPPLDFKKLKSRKKRPARLRSPIANSA